MKTLAILVYYILNMSKTRKFSLFVLEPHFSTKMATKEQLEKEHAEAKAKLEKIDKRLDKANDDYDNLKERSQHEGLSEDLKFLLTAAERQQAELRQQRGQLLARITELEKLLAPPPVPATSQKEGKFISF